METKEEEKGQGREGEDLGADLKVKGRRKGGDRLKRDVDQRRAGQLPLSNQVSGGGTQREAAGNERKLKSQREYNANGFRSDVKKKMSTSF